MNPLSLLTVVFLGLLLLGFFLQLLNLSQIGKEIDQEHDEDEP